MEISSFWVILAACLVPVALGVLATLRDEEIAKRGGFHKTHI